MIPTFSPMELTQVGRHPSKLIPLVGLRKFLKMELTRTFGPIHNNTGNGQSASSVHALWSGIEPLEQSIIDVWSAQGAYRGSFRVSYFDPVKQIVYSSDPLPNGISLGDYLIVKSGEIRIDCGP